MESVLLSQNTIKIGDIKDPSVWINVKAKVIQLWGNNSESISQVGLLGDETGTIKFVSWRKSNLPPLEENKSYLIENVIVDSWNDRLQINLSKTTKIIPLEGDIKANDSKSGIEGTIKDIIPKSGLIFRCPHCKRVLIEDVVCAVHAEVEPFPDLRVKARLETKNGSCPILLNREITENIIGITLEEAQKIGKHETLERIKNRLIGMSFNVGGSLLSGGNFLVKRIMPLNVV